MNHQSPPTPTTSNNPWELTVDGYNPAHEAAVEAVLALVNGRCGWRAGLEEGQPNADPALFLAGIFNTPSAPQAPELEEAVPELVVAPDPCRLSIRLDGQPLDLAHAELLSMTRTLDMRHGLLRRKWRLRDKQGRITRLHSERFASLEPRHALGYRLSLSAENYQGELKIEFALDAATGQPNQGRNVRVLELSAGAEQDWLLVATTSGQYEIGMAAATRWVTQTPSQSVPVLSNSAIGQAWQINIEPEQIVTFERVITFCSSRESPQGLTVAQQRLAELGGAAGYAKLREQHCQAWETRWEASAVTIAGDVALQREINFALYHLHGAAAPDDERTSIGARALTGERYRGHVFWDTEIFVWPFMLYTEPATARALLLYRYHTLAGARAKATAMGYRGAMFPWEAADSGEEVTPAFMLSGGERVPVLTGIQEHHISADIAYAVLCYLQVSGDEDFLVPYGAELLIEIARFWVSRAEPSSDGSYHLSGVIGPDEYHETIDDNAYTNLLVRETLRASQALIAPLAENAPAGWTELQARLGFDFGELATWQEVAEGLAINIDSTTGLIEQFRGYHELAPIDLRDHNPNIATVDAKLGWYAMQKTKVLKQADVVMALILLWEQFDRSVHEANFAYYEPNTAHDSSLSASFHALFAARLGQLPLAERYLRQATQIDLDLSRKGQAGASGGVHIAALGGVWQALAFGFLGLQASDEGLRVHPQIPPAWETLRLVVHWRGRRVAISANPQGEVEWQRLTGPPLQIATGDEAWRTLE